MLPAALATYQTLRELSPLAEFDTNSLEKLATCGEILTLAPGYVLFSEGERHDRLYVVMSGIVRLEMLTAKCGRQTILSVGRGDFLAWSSLIGDGIMTATALTGSEVKMVVFETLTLQKLMNCDSKMAYELMRELAKSLSRRLLATRLQLLDLYQS